MDETKNIEKIVLSEIPEIVKAIIFNPTDFFRNMPREGGFLQPLIFMAVMGVIKALISILMHIVGFGHGRFGMAIGSLLFSPVVFVVVGFITAAVVFVIWKLLGYSASYESAFRCTAYATGIVPITAILAMIPYIGTISGIAWTAFLLVTASTAVCGIQVRKAWIVFGAIAVVLAGISLRTEYTSRKMLTELENLERKFNSSEIEKMTPEKAGKMMGEFLKGMKESGKDK